jgi:hypothetical protein
MLSRALWHVNRTQLGWAVKAGASAWNLGGKLERRREAQALAATASELSKAEDLRRDGYAVVTDLIEPAILSEMHDAAHERLARIEKLEGSQSLTHKKFWVRLLDGDMQDGKLSADNVFVRYGLQPAVIRTLSSVFGEVPWLDYVLLSHSRHSEDELAYSQLWHRDHDDMRVVKLFTYLTDVLEDGDGPFTFLPRQPTTEFGRPIVGSHFKDERVFARVDRSRLKIMKAPKLASFIVETSSCLHMGSRMAPGHGRLMYTATYFSFPRIFPGARNRPFVASDRTTPLEKLVMGL